jgi:hypothetical protein
MSLTDMKIRNLALDRLAKIFSVEVDLLDRDAKFGADLQSSFVSDFRDNELDVILEDIRFVADKRALADLNAGILVIDTVRKYCDHMVASARENRNRVVQVLVSASNHNQ